jgi:hypothetical protein
MDVALFFQSSSLIRDHKRSNSDLDDAAALTRRNRRGPGARATVERTNDGQFDWACCHYDA